MEKKVLIIDDETHLVKMVKMRLESNGYVVISAENGMLGVQKALAEQPDVILLDIQMPEMDGNEALKKLKELEKTKNIPVIMFTAKGQVETIEKVFDVGAVDYIIKPFSPAILLNKISDVLYGKK